MYRGVECSYICMHMYRSPQEKVGGFVFIECIAFYDLETCQEKAARKVKRTVYENLKRMPGRQIVDERVGYHSVDKREE